jgi:UDP-glucuronate 4-epimerase
MTSALPRTILVTGAAGFIGSALSKRLLSEGCRVIGIDDFNSYYPVELKEARVADIGSNPAFTLVRGDISDKALLEKVFSDYEPEAVVNLAAQAGVRYSIENPDAYTRSNLVGFANLLECCRHHKVGHFVFASSSSVYGKNKKVPFSEDDRVDFPVSYYAATKKANELMAASYANLYKLPLTGLRFFTVYGPWGRPDMAPWLFTDAILAGRPIKVFNNGDMMRDFTFIDDIVEGVVRVIGRVPQGDFPYEIFNIGNHSPVRLMDFIHEIEKACGREAEKIMLPMQAGDVPVTYADTAKLEAAVGFKPATPLSVGIPKFVEWFKWWKAESAKSADSKKH